MKRTGIGVVALLGAIALPAQETSGLPQWVLQLSRVKRRARANFERLPNYVCLETVERFDKPPRAPAFRHLDTLRLEVAVVGGKELFAPAGGSRFEAESLSFARGGAFGTGAFFSMARNLFVADVGRTTGWSTESIGGRGALRFDWEIPQMLGPSLLRYGDVQAVVGDRGSFWVDAETLDLLEIESFAVDIPFQLNMLDAKMDIRYAPMRIGSSVVILPETAEMLIANFDGRQTRNITTFTGCREYRSDSTITFGDEPLPAPPPTPPTPGKKQAPPPW